MVKRHKEIHCLKLFSSTWAENSEKAIRVYSYVSHSLSKELLVIQERNTYMIVMQNTSS